MTRQVLRFLLIVPVVYFGIALGLIFSQFPQARLDGETLDFMGLPKAGPLLATQITVASGETHQAYFTKGPVGAPLLVLVHGSGWYGGQFGAVMPRLAKSADVLAVNLRGHHLGPGTRGDVSYVGQFEDDLAALILAMRKPGQPVVLAGHSSGGGLVVRMVAGDHGALIDKAILIAPFLKYNAPTTRPNSGGWAVPLTRRIIGLSMLNTFGIHALDHLTVLQFRMPPEADPNGFATLAYSHRLNTSYAPRAAYLEDIAALPRFLLIAGAQDESMQAELYQPTMSAVTDQGQYAIVPGAGHLDILHASETLTLVEAFIEP